MGKWMPTRTRMKSIILMFIATLAEGAIYYWWHYPLTKVISLSSFGLIIVASCVWGWNNQRRLQRQRDKENTYMSTD